MWGPGGGGNDGTRYRETRKNTRCYILTSLKLNLTFDKVKSSTLDFFVVKLYDIILALSDNHSRDFYWKHENKNAIATSRHPVWLEWCHCGHGKSKNHKNTRAAS